VLHNLKFHVYHCSFKKYFRLGMHIMAALVKCSALDEIGTIVSHVSSVQSHLWEACHKEHWNHQSSHWWKWKPRNVMWDRGTVHFGLLNYVIYIPSQFNTCHDPFFTSLQMVCLDEIDNYVEIVLISCMACTDLDCRKQFIIITPSESISILNWNR